VACDGGMVTVLDLGSGIEVGCAPIAGPPDAIWYNAERRRLYVAIAEPGMVEVIDTESMTTVQLLVTEAGAHTTAFDRAHQRLVVFLAASCQAAIYRDT
jgi:hypothetical protein